MTINEAITKFDSVCRNNIPVEIKIDWLSYLDSRVYNEIILTHENCEAISFSPYDTDTPSDTVLIIPAPYSDIYIIFLTMKKDLYMSDISRYNNDLALFKTAYLDYENYYNSKNMHIKNISCFNV